jgi:hypothetical protein
MHHSSSEKPSCWTARLRSRCSIESNVPFFVHMSKTYQTVDQGPSSPAKSRHGAPVRKTQKIASSIVRRSPARRPVLTRVVGNRSATNSHCGSVSRWRGMRIFPMPLLDHEIAVGTKN